MSLNSILTTSLTGLFTNQTAINVTSNNIANVNTENYARSRVVQEAAVLQGQTAGVQIGEIQRVVDRFLEASYRTALSNTREFEVQSVFHDRLQGLLGTPDSENSLAQNINDVFSAFADVSIAPSEILRRTDALSDLQNYLSQIDRIQSSLQDLRADASLQLVEAVETVNEQIRRIGELNPLLVAGNVAGSDTSGLENQIGEALNTISSFLDIQISRGDQGAVTVFTSSGVSLVDSGFVQLEYDAPGIVTGDTIFPPVTAQRVDPRTLQPEGISTNLSGSIRSGEIAGLVNLRDDDLVDLSVSLGELAARVRDEFNRVHNSYSAVPPPNTLTGDQTIVDGGHDLNFTGEVTFAVVNSSTTVLGDSVTVNFDAQTIDGAVNAAAFADYTSLLAAVNGALAGGTLTLASGVMSFDATAATDGVIIQDSETTPSSRAGRGFSHFFGMNNLITSDERGIFETGVLGTDAHNIGAGGAIDFVVRDELGREVGSQSIPQASLGTTFDDVVTALNNVGTGIGNFFTFALDPATGQITSTANTVGLSFEVRADTTQIGTTGITLSGAFGLGDRFRVDAARNLEVVSDVASDPNRLSLSAFDLTALPAAGATLIAGDQRGALAFLELERQLVGFEDAGELDAASVTLSQYTARFLANSGQIAERVSDLSEDNRALQEEVFQRQASISGVNLDEELANLVIFQNAYSAAARVLSSVQELFDDLLSAV